MYRKFLIIFMMILPFGVYAQTDTVVYSEELLSKEQAVKNSWYAKYFIKEPGEVKHFWKLNLSDYLRFRPSLIFEQRLSDNSLFHIKTNLDFRSILGSGTYIVNYDEGLGEITKTHLSNMALEVTLDYRYFFNLERRKQNDLYTHGFSASYFAIGVHSRWNTINEKVNVEDVEFASIQNGQDATRADRTGIKILTLQPVVNGNYTEMTIKYGFHRRIGNIGYVDLYGGIGLGKSNLLNHIYLKPLLGFDIGFAFSGIKK